MSRVPPLLALCLVACLMAPCAFAHAEPTPPRRGLLTSQLAYARLSAAQVPLSVSRDVFVGQLGYARRVGAAGALLGASMEFGFAPIPTHGLRKALGVGVHAGWDIGAAQAVVLETYAAPVYAWTQGEALQRPRGIGLLAGATLAVPWLQRKAVELAGSHLPESLLALPLVLLPNAVGVRIEHLPGDGALRFGVTVGWSFAAALWR